MSQSDGHRLGAMISHAGGRVIDAAGMIKLYGGRASRCPIVSIEYGMTEDG